MYRTQFIMRFTTMGVLGVRRHMLHSCHLFCCHGTPCAGGYMPFTTSDYIGLHIEAHGERACHHGGSSPSCSLSSTMRPLVPGTVVFLVLIETCNSMQASFARLNREERKQKQRSRLCRIVETFVTNENANGAHQRI